MTRTESVLSARRIAVVGVGGGGGNAVEAMAAEWESGPVVIALDSDVQDLAACAVHTRLRIGEKITRGLSAGGDPKVGRLAAEDNLEDVRGLCAGMELVFLVVTLGGGTGSGAAPVLAQAAHEAGALVIAFATLPFSFEGRQRMAQAREALAALRHEADAVVLMPNDRLFEAAGPTGGHEEAFRRADEIIGTGVSAIWKMLVERGVINMDFAALRNLVRHSEGISVFGYGQGEGPDKAEVAVRTALASPLFENRQVLARAAAVLVSIIGGPDLTLTELRAIMERVEGAVRRDAHLLMGNVSDPRWQGQVAVTLIASEHWRDEPEPEGVPKTPETESGKGDDAAKARRARRKATEAQLRLPGQDKGIFKDVEPTIVDGQDLDLPTYRRRGVVLGK